MARNVMIPEELFLDLVRYHLLEVQDQDLVARIREGLEEKLTAAARREAYSQAIKNKTTPP